MPPKRPPAELPAIAPAPPNRAAVQRDRSGPLAIAALPRHTGPRRRPRRPTLRTPGPPAGPLTLRACRPDPGGGAGPGFAPLPVAGPPCPARLFPAPGRVRTVAASSPRRPERRPSGPASVILSPVAGIVPAGRATPPAPSPGIFRACNTNAAGRRRRPRCRARWPPCRSRRFGRRDAEPVDRAVRGAMSPRGAACGCAIASLAGCLRADVTVLLTRDQWC